MTTVSPEVIDNDQCPAKHEHDWPIDKEFVSVVCMICGYERINKQCDLN